MASENEQDLKRFWLKKTEIFSHLSENEIDIVSSHSALLETLPEQKIFLQGDGGESLYIVIEGNVTIVKQTDAQESSVIAELISGESFGEMEFLTGARHNATAIAQKNTRLIQFPGKSESSSATFEGEPKIQAKVLHSFLNLISTRIRNSNALLKENSLWVQELKHQVYGDKLTGLFNKTYLEEELPNLLANKDKPISLLLMKPDNFKQINDAYGHEAGDESLKLMAAELKHRVDGTGTCLKYLGNELGVILPGVDKNGAKKIAEDIQHGFNQINVNALTGGIPFKITVSIGIACFPIHGNDSETIISKAHNLPLIGRSRGGNQILFPEDAECGTA